MRFTMPPSPRRTRFGDRARAIVVCAAVLTLVVGTVVPSTVVAQTTTTTTTPTTEAPADARRLFLEGDQAYRIGDYEAAVRAWQQGYALDPRPRFLYNLAQAYERLGSLPEAVTALDSYVHAITLDDPLYGEATARLASLRQRLASTGVRVVGGPGGSEIYIDEQAWGATPRPDRIPITPGNHQVSIRFASGGRYEVAIAVAAGQVVDVRIPDDAAAQPTNVVTTPVVGTTPSGPATVGTEPAPGHTLLIVGAATAGVGAGLLIYGIARQTALSGCSDPGYVCLSEGPVRTQRTLGMVAGSLLLAGGASLIVIDLVRDRSASTQARLGVGIASLELTVRH